MNQIINIIKLKIINFIRNNKYKLKDLGQKLIIVAMGIFIATIILSVLSESNKDKTNTNNEIYNVYKPTETVISGEDVSKEQFEEDKNIVETFLEFCNNKKAEEAYNLISDECKKEKYPKLEDFQKYYLNYIFDEKRQYNLQAWINESYYRVYKIRYTNNMLATGKYDETNVYEDYITINKRNGTEKISIGSFIDSKDCNIVTERSGIKATVVNKKVFISEEEYELHVKNNTDKVILLDNLKSNSTIWLVANGVNYRPNTNKIYITDLMVEPGKTNKIIIRVMKNLNSVNESNYIQFKKVITDYNTYIENNEAYTDFIEIKVNVEE